MTPNTWRWAWRCFRTGGSNPAGVLRLGGSALVGSADSVVLSFVVCLMFLNAVLPPSLPSCPPVASVRSLRGSVTNGLRGAVGQQVQQLRWHFSVCPVSPGEHVPLQLSCDRGGGRVMKRWWMEAGLVSGALRAGRLLGLQDEVVGCRWAVVRDTGEAVGRVSDQGSRFGLITSVPLHIGQL